MSNGVLFYLMFAVIFLESVTDETFSGNSFHFSNFTYTYEFRDKLIISNIPWYYVYKLLQSRNWILLKILRRKILLEFNWKVESFWP